MNGHAARPGLAFIPDLIQFNFSTEFVTIHAELLQFSTEFVTINPDLIQFNTEFLPFLLNVIQKPI